MGCPRCPTFPYETSPPPQTANLDRFDCAPRAHDKLFVSLPLLSRRPEPDIFTTLTDSLIKNELPNFKRRNREPLQGTGRDDAIPIHRTLLDMLSSSQIPANTRNRLNDRLSDFVKRQDAHYKLLLRHVSGFSHGVSQNSFKLRMGMVKEMETVL